MPWSEENFQSTSALATVTQHILPSNVLVWFSVNIGNAKAVPIVPSSRERKDNHAYHSFASIWPAISNAQDCRLYVKQSTLISCIEASHDTRYLESQCQALPTTGRALHTTRPNVSQLERLFGIPNFLERFMLTMSQKLSLNCLMFSTTSLRARCRPSKFV